MDCGKAVRDMSGKVFLFPQETSSAYVKITPIQETFSAVTVCHRTFTDLNRDHTIFSLATKAAYNGFLIYMGHGGQTVAPHIQDVRIDFRGIDYAPNTWHSICTTWDAASGLVQVWLDGRMMSKKYITEKAINGKPIIILGQDQDSYGGGFDSKQSFVGMMTDVHMWDRVLSPHEIQKFMKDQRFTPGNVLNWGALDCEIKGRVLIEEKLTDYCNCSN